MHKTDTTTKNYLAPNAEIEKPCFKGNQTWSFWGPWWLSSTGKEKNLLIMTLGSEKSERKEQDWQGGEKKNQERMALWKLSIKA